jgi:hypothetical protein
MMEEGEEVDMYIDSIGHVSLQNVRCRTQRHTWPGPWGIMRDSNPPKAARGIMRDSNPPKAALKPGSCDMKNLNKHID